MQAADFGLWAVRIVDIANVAFCHVLTVDHFRRGGDFYRISAGIERRAIDATRAGNVDAADIRTIVPGAVLKVLRTDSTATGKLKPIITITIRCNTIMHNVAIKTDG